MPKHPCVYILASRRDGTLYTGVTTNLQRRTWQHRQGLAGEFTQKYHVKRLVFFEFFGNMPNAIKREKQIRTWSRKRKLALIESVNPDWEDLYFSLFN